MKKRPVSVTIIAWMITLAGVFSFPLVLTNFFTSEFQRFLLAARIPAGLSLALSILSGVIALFSGIAMLRGFNWGRLLYLFFVPISLVIGYLLYGFREIYILTAIGYIIIVIFLTRPAAKIFFKNQDAGGLK